MRDLLTRSLPVEVRARFEGVDFRKAGLAVLTRHGVAELRATVVPIEFRNDDEALSLSGYDATFDTWYDVAGGPEHGGWIESIAPGAFTKSLRENEDIRLLVNHDGVPIARTKSGTLRISTDDLGRYIDAPNLDRSNPRVRELASALSRGDVDQMSHAFQVTRQEWSKDYTERRILEVRSFDSSVVTYPANPATIVGLRTDAQIVERPGLPLALALAQAEALAL